MIEYSNKYIELTPDSPAVPGARNTQALAYFRLGQNEQAFNIWNELLRLHPDMPEVYFNIGQALYQMNDLDRARTHLLRALRLRPNLAEARQFLNIVQRTMEIDNSIAQLQSVIQLKSNDHTLHGQLASALSQRGKHDKAIEHWRQALKLKPDWIVAYDNLAWILINAEDQNIRRPAEALTLALQAADLTLYNQPDVLETLSLAYAANDNIPAAIATAEKGLTLALSAQNQPLAQKFRQHLKSFR
ncbi:MAG: tetratricopeptide repeat protein [Planctomycetes bacterium]|nr:tetratricopeptide repeat protein [Planctomycetota bacterium]